MSQQYVDTQAVDFKQGATFSFLLQLPSLVSEGQLAGWTLKSQIRRQGNDQVSGFIADLEASWVDAEKAMTVRVFKSDTSQWPVGICEFDVVFTAPVDAENPTAAREVIKSVNVYVNVLGSVTE
jgi:hypothetical protein